MIATVASLLPDFAKQALEALKNASPVLLIIIGAVLFIFSGAMKWLAKWIGIGLFIYGVLTLLGYL